MPRYDATTKVPRFITSMTFEVATTLVINASTP